MNTISRKTLLVSALAVLVVVGGGCALRSPAEEQKVDRWNLENIGKQDKVDAGKTSSTTIIVRPEFPGMEDVIIPEDWKEFKDENLGISFRYPGNMRFVSMSVESADTSKTPDHFFLKLAPFKNAICDESITIGLAKDTKARNKDNEVFVKQSYKENLDQSNPDMYGGEYVRWVLSTESGYKYYYVSGDDRNSHCFDLQKSEDGRKILQDYKGVLKSLEIKVAPTNGTLTLPKIIRPEFPRMGSEDIEIPSNWKEFKDENLGISFRYSPEMTLESATSNSPDGFGFELSPKSKTVCNDKIFIGLTTDTIARKMGYKDNVGQRYSEDLEQYSPVHTSLMNMYAVEYAWWVQNTGEDYKFYYVGGNATLNCFHPMNEATKKMVDDYRKVLKSLKIDIKE